MISDHTIADDSGAGLLPTIACFMVNFSIAQMTNKYNTVHTKAHHRLLPFFTQHIFLAPSGAEGGTMFVRPSSPSLSTPRLIAASSHFSRDTFFWLNNPCLRLMTGVRWDMCDGVTVALGPGGHKAGSVMGACSWCAQILAYSSRLLLLN